jgi:hypothetical protein
MANALRRYREREARCSAADRQPAYGSARCSDGRWTISRGTRRNPWQQIIAVFDTREEMEQRLAELRAQVAA